MLLRKLGGREAVFEPLLTELNTAMFTEELKKMVY